MLHAAVLRSPHPHARITSVDSSRARALEGVVAVLSGAELAEMIDPLPRFCAEEVVEHAVAVDKVRYAGEAVAIAVAESRYLAEDALELVEVDYELLEPLVDPFAAAEPGAPLAAREPRHQRRLREDASRTATSRATSRAPRT